MSPPEIQKTPPSQRPLRVLIVEDNPADAELVVALLKRAGYAIAFEVVDSTTQLQQRLSQTAWDLILSDHNLRTWTGMEALDIVRKSGRATPFIVVTATLGDEAAVEYVKQGAADYVLKHRLERLPAAVGAVLRERAHRAEAARLQEQILCAKREWELTFDTVPDPVFLLDDQCRVQRCNRAASEILGLPFSQLIGRPCYEVIHGLSEKRPDCPHTRLLQSGQQEHGDVEEPRLGKVFHSTCTPLRDPGGGLRGCVQVMRDVTERRRTEDALRESERRVREQLAELERIYGTAPVGLALFDRDLRYVRINEQLAAMDGRSAEEHIGRTAREVVPEVAEKVEPLLRNILATGEPVVGLEITTMDPETRQSRVALVSYYPLKAEDGSVRAINAVVLDVTERQLMQKQIGQLQKFEAIGQLAGGIAHDFNNVIGAILGWAEIGLEEATPQSRAHSHLQRIRDQAQRAAGLTRQLLAFARRQVLEPRNLNLNQVVSDVTSFLRKAIPANIELKLNLASDLATVHADPTQMEQIIMNFCLNARDAMSAQANGQMVVETQNTEIDEDYCRFHVYAKPGRYVLLSVSDNGVGMDAATQEHIFEPFFTTKEVGKGTGLGLATVYGIVKQHGGFTHVYSEPGHGSIFRVYLPCVPAAAEEPPPPESEPVRGGKETILVAEDHEGGREMVCEILGKLGYAVLAAANGEEAVQIFQAHRDEIALLLLDVVMPKLSGPEAFHRIEAIRPGLPVVFATGYSAEVELLNSLMEDHRHLVQKPYNPKTLARKVRQLLDRAGPSIPSTS